MMSRLLLVDDDKTLLQFLSEYLTGDGFEVITASNGTDALRMAYQNHPELVVLDVMMPGMDGWEVCARLHEMTGVPVILVTGKTTEADKLRGFKLGADDYLTKPFSFAELSARIQAVLARSLQFQGNTVNLINLGNLVINPEKRSVKQSDKELQLTPTEYRLLEYLARNQGRAVPEAELAQAVWGNYREEDASTVRRFIWLLRKKVEEDPSDPKLVKTVRGFGYRMGTRSLKLPDDYK
jgi:two-component system KDP operon response regulator KdpE